MDTDTEGDKEYSPNDGILKTLQVKFGENQDLISIATLCDKVLSQEVTSDDIAKEDVIINLFSKVEEFKQTQQGFKTSELWLMYLGMVNILCKMTKAERTGNASIFCIIWTLLICKICLSLPSVNV